MKLLEVKDVNCSSLCHSVSSSGKSQRQVVSTHDVAGAEPLHGLLPGPRPTADRRPRPSAQRRPWAVLCVPGQVGRPTLRKLPWSFTKSRAQAPPEGCGSFSQGVPSSLHVTAPPTVLTPRQRGCDTGGVHAGPSGHRV